MIRFVHGILARQGGIFLPEKYHALAVCIHIHPFL